MSSSPPSYLPAMLLLLPAAHGAAARGTLARGKEVAEEAPAPVVPSSSTFPCMRSLFVLPVPPPRTATCAAAVGRQRPMRGALAMLLQSRRTTLLTTPDPPASPPSGGATLLSPSLPLLLMPLPSILFVFLATLKFPASSWWKLLSALMEPPPSLLPTFSTSGARATAPSESSAHSRRIGAPFSALGSLGTDIFMAK